MDKNISGSFIKKKVYFSQVSNSALRDSSLSLKAKGLYAIIQSYVTIEDFILYKATLKKMCIEGEKSFESTWKELKDAGYLIQYRHQKEKGHYYYEYELLDIANKEYADEIHSKQNRKKAEEKNHTPKKDVMDNGYNGQGGVYNKTDLNNTDLSNKDKKTTTTASSGSTLNGDVPTANELEIYQAFKNSLGKPPNNSVKLQIRGILSHQETELVVTAIQMAAQNNKEWNYAKGILTKWKAKGIVTISQYLAEEDL